MAFRNLETADLAGKVALVRVDFNVPMDGGEVSDDTRLRSALPTIHFLSTKGAKVVLIAHFDRPKGKRVPEMSLSPVVPALEQLLGRKVAFADDCIGNDAASAIARLADGDDGPLRIGQRPAERLELGLHGTAGIGRQKMGDAFGRGVGAVGGAEGVVDIEVA